MRPSDEPSARIAGVIERLTETVLFDSIREAEARRAIVLTAARGKAGRARRRVPRAEAVKRGEERRKLMGRAIEAVERLIRPLSRLRADSSRGDFHSGDEVADGRAEDIGVVGRLHGPLIGRHLAGDDAIDRVIIALDMPTAAKVKVALTSCAAISSSSCTSSRRDVLSTAVGSMSS